ncbi:hypothetical protein BDP81DRAFT_86005 [Colletotrichum phormii]|uniref:Fungal N-terminal domain-containing protein n=1 Tax=Colletotrichum phormii TaxID=359342 RepID=A0AAJ0A1A1_9PEZI|nr:uncharacterized protein BDP81DRAFT_86005 [Colletotrichum phormii]KAK1654620.1 hypothetical protein BDP81DRAFT_86005 [Colletotrichum phormii]
MADPLSIAGSAVGIISLGIQVAQSLYQFYSTAKGQHSDVARTLRKLQDLQSLLERLDTHHRCRPNPCFGLCFFFFSFSDKFKQDPSAMLRALILQLSDQLDYIPPALKRIHDLGHNHNVPPSRVELLQCFRQVVRCFHDVHIVLDALDESPQGERRSSLLETLQEIRAWSEPGLHLSVTSRDEVDIREGIDAEQKMVISLKNGGIDDDIASYVSQHLQQRLREWSKHHPLIRKILIEKAHGVFRWVECQFKTIETCPRSKQALDRRLQSLPPTLDETYKRMLETVLEEEEYARQMLTILCCAVVPLTVPEMIDAMAVEIGTTSFWNPDRQLPDADALQEICPGFTETAMDHERGTSVIRIAHFSVQEYLESDRILLQEGSASFSIRKPYGNLMLASMCLTMLLDSRFRTLELREIYQQHPFAIYAARHWPNHWQKSNETDATLALCGDFSHRHPKVSHGKLILRLQDQMILFFRDSNGGQ